MTLDISRVIKKPLITEKSIKNTRAGKFTFIVDQRAEKKSIKKAVEKYFSVDVLKVWTIKTKGEVKIVSRFKRKKIKQPDWKKAIVKLKEGQTIELFELEKDNKKKSKKKK